jgi:hypothetical protein
MRGGAGRGVGWGEDGTATCLRDIKKEATRWGRRTIDQADPGRAARGTE